MRDDDEFTGSGVTLRIASIIARPYRYDEPVSTTVTPLFPTMNPLFATIPRLAGATASPSPSIT